MIRTNKVKNTTKIFSATAFEVRYSEKGLIALKHKKDSKAAQLGTELLQKDVQKKMKKFSSDLVDGDLYEEDYEELVFAVENYLNQFNTDRRTVDDVDKYIELNKIGTLLDIKE